MRIKVQEFGNEKAGKELRVGERITIYVCTRVCVYICVRGLVLILDSETAPTLRIST